MTTARAGLRRSVVATPLVAAAVLLGAAGRVFDESKFKDEFGIDYDDEIVDEHEGEHVLVADRISTLAGERVKVAGDVSDLISTVAFRLDGVGWDVVVIDAADAKVDLSDFVQVTGTVQRFDLQSVEKELGRDLQDDLYDSFDGDLVLVADKVENVAPPA